MIFFIAQVTSLATTEKKWQKTDFWPDFGLFWPKFGSQIIFFVGFTYTRCYTLLQAIIVCNFKEN